MAELIIALDCDIKRAEEVVECVGGRVNFFKVGPVMFIRYGRSIIDFLVSKNLKVFLDLKLHDIPNTVSTAIKNAADMGVYSISVHTLGGSEMLEKAVAVARGSIKLWGITVLTSMMDEDLIKIGIKKSVNEEVLNLAKLAKCCGVDGIVSSARDLDYIKKDISGLKFITPSIRLMDSGDDQKRFTSPSFAVEHGSDYLVVGRPVIESNEPLKAVEKILEEMNGKR
ncbi:MAG: orotidine-5'-phosphate decarboxylase [Elusimicrobia bacterium]|nr:orotidine-5'-phosphate decarboxylase [Elusimicrobiota bacterium]